MPRSVPLEYLIAETRAWPLSAEAGFDRGLLRLRRVNGRIDKPTQGLSDSLEKHLRLRAGGMSISVLERLRDESWFRRDADALNPTPGLEDDVALAPYLVAMTRRYLRRRGPDVILRECPTYFLPAIEWRWISFSLPADLLIAALFADDRDEPTVDRVTLPTPHLARVLERHVALTHLHVGAAFSFSCLWTMLTRCLASDPPSPRDFRTPAEDLPFGNAERFVRALAAAAICRLLLAHRLMNVETHRDFPHRNAWEMASNVTTGSERDRIVGWIEEALQALLSPGLSRSSRHELLFAYRALVGAETAYARRQPLPRRDPLAGWLVPRRGLAVCETRFATRAIRHLLDHPDDRTFAELFWQYQRIRNLTHRFLVAEPLTAGMDWFQRHYDRIASLRGGLDAQLYRIALELETEGMGLESLEVRTRPTDRWTDIRDEAAKLAEQAHGFAGATGVERPEVGLVLHFIKAPFGASGRRPNADPRHTVHASRFGPWFADASRQAGAIATALDFHPELLLVLRGIDAASLELEVPTWALIPLFTRVDDAARRAADRLNLREPRWTAQTTRHTLHVGEDFRRLIDGIRRMHEPIEFGMLRTGDRIGHGLALGLDPSRWCNAATSVPQPAEERLDDLLWELERYRSGDWRPATDRLELVKHEALTLAAGIYNDAALGFDNPTLFQLIRARHLRHSAAFLDTIGYPNLENGAPALPLVEHRLAYAYLGNPDVYDRGQTPIQVPIGPGELEMLRQAQAWLRGRLAQMEITIESNPSSNWLVADMIDLGEHPLLRLQGMSGDSPADGPDVMVSINDDDPVSFATRLSDEYAYVYFALLRRGSSSQHALADVERLRDNGWRSRFTLPASADPRALRRMLQRIGWRSAADADTANGPFRAGR